MAPMCFDRAGMTRASKDDTKPLVFQGFFFVLVRHNA